MTPPSAITSTGGKSTPRDSTHVVHVLASAATSWGGPPVVIRDLSSALIARGVENTVVCLTDSHSPTISFSDRVNYRPCGNAVIPGVGIPSSASLFGEAFRAVRKADIVHLHEVWHFPHVLGGVLARTIGRPHVVSPHGVFDPWITRQHRTVKRLAWVAYQRRIMGCAMGIHVLTAQEKTDVDSLGLRARIAIIPSGVDIALIDETRRAAAETGESPARPYVLFLGRLVPKKGPDILLKSFSEISAERPDLRLILAGPDTLGFWPTLRHMAREFGILDRVSYVGVADRLSKFRLFAGAELFVLPSLSEGFSIALLEALTCGVPSVVSTRCNMPEVETAGAGRVVEPTTAAVSGAMREVLGDDSLRQTMGRNARTLVDERFSIEQMASKMARFYRNVLSGAD